MTAVTDVTRQNTMTGRSEKPRVAAGLWLNAQRCLQVS
jgi:hypothetical protein